jgi:hypothetical protein
MSKLVSRKRSHSDGLRSFTRYPQGLLPGPFACVTQVMCRRLDRERIGKIGKR